jgi:hypothetical protein
MEYTNLSKKEIQTLLDEQMQVYKDFQKQKLALDMSRGKPCKAQLEISTPMFDLINSKTDFKLSNGIDARNYGCLEGTPECRKLFADLFDLKPSQVIIRQPQP